MHEHDEDQMELNAQMQRGEKELPITNDASICTIQHATPWTPTQPLPYPAAAFGTYSQYDPDATQDGL